MTLENLIKELEEKTLEEIVTSKEFKRELDGLLYDWEPSVRDILKEDLEAYRG